jgi:hypothetical protein
MALVALLIAVTTVEAQVAQLEQLRAEVGAQIQVRAFDLLDELVFGWTQAPLFGSPTAVVLADVTVPVGLGTGLRARIENHLAELVIAHPETSVQLSHCPQCSAILVHSGATGTVVSRGIDAPDALTQIGSMAGSRHALFLDFEAEGAALVLRARVTAIEPNLPVLFARTLSSSTGVAPLLRSPEHLKSAAEARQEYLDLLNGKSNITVPVKVAVRTYAVTDFSPVVAAPMVWLQTGIEVGLTQAQAWTGQFMVGYSWMPDTHEGWLAQTRIARLLSGRARSLTAPDLYGFVGFGVMSVKGFSSVLFKDETVTVDDLVAAAAAELLAGLDPKPSINMAIWHVGLELRVKNRISFAAFLESIPSVSDSSDIVGGYIDIGLVRFESIGAEVSFCF